VCACLTQLGLVVRLLIIFPDTFPDITIRQLRHWFICSHRGHIRHRIWPSIGCLSPLRLISISSSNYLQLHRTENVRLTLPSPSLDRHLQKILRHAVGVSTTRACIFRKLGPLQPDETHLYTFSLLESATTHRCIHFYLFAIDHSQSTAHYDASRKTFLGFTHC